MWPQERPGEPQDVTMARRFWAEKKNAKAALDRFPRRCNVERDILFGFMKGCE